MKLHIENAPEHEKLLQHAFDVVTKSYGIAGKPFTVNCRLARLRPSGTTGYDPSHPDQALIMLSNKLKHIPSHKGRIGKPYSLLEVFCHEMVHIKQHILDGLSGDIVKNGHWFKGDFYPGELLELLELGLGPDVSPWEEEAYESMFKLAQLVEATPKAGQ